MTGTAHDPVRVLTRFATGDGAIDPHLSQEWLVTNGLGGYASGTVLGPITRRYHGLLIAALPNPLGRYMMLHGLSERFRVRGGAVAFAGPRYSDGSEDGPPLTPVEFRLECGLPVWVYQFAKCRIEKRIVLAYKQNTVHIAYRYLEGTERVRLGLRPGLHFRSHDAAVDSASERSYWLTARDDRLELTCGSDLPVLRLKTTPVASFAYHPASIAVDYQFERRRGYAWQGSIWSPGYFRTDLEPGSAFVLTASTEPWEIIEAMPWEEAFSSDLSRRRAVMARAADPAGSLLQELVLAADQFLITPVGRQEDSARALAEGQYPQTVIAGYHWFTDWGRDTMISLEGLALTVGRTQEAGWILRTFANYVCDGLIPNLFPEGERQGLYHTADASLWYVHAVSRYLDLSGDRQVLRTVLPKLREIADAHLAGTRFGIHVDPKDGLLAQGQEGYQLTWMDAKVGDWVVTPRRGKAVEINALWYNALCLIAKWMEEENVPAAARYREAARQARESFNRRFWNPQREYLFDVVDGQSGGGEPGDDPSCRPNQLFAISLENPVLDRERWKAVVDAATKHLLTPVGLRSLAPGEPEYKPRYDGDLRSRDAAYHQGSVWGWLIGPYVDALAKVYPERCRPELLDGFAAHLDDACIGSISEIFDAEAPHTPRGCVAQAWSVAEVLRCRVKLAGNSAGGKRG